MTVALAEPEVVESYEAWQCRQPHLPRVHIAELVREAWPYPQNAKSTNRRGWEPYCLRTNGFRVIFPTLCEDCEGEGTREEPVLQDSGMCSDCESNYEYCRVCDEWLSTDCCDQPCRHLFWAEWGEWIGAGAGSSDWHYCREGFERLLWALRPKNIVTMRAKLAAHDYGGCNVNLLQPRETAIDYDRYTRCPSVRDTMGSLERRGNPNAALLYAGLGWVTTLEVGKTDEADNLTVQWIDSWVFRQTYRDEDG